MLEEGGRLEPCLHPRANQDEGNMASAVRRIGEIRLVEGNNEQAGLLEGGTRHQGTDRVAKPGVGIADLPVVGAGAGAVGTSIARAVYVVGHDKEIIWQRVR